MKIQFYFLALLMLCCYGYTNAQRWNPILLRGRGFEYASFGIGMGIGFK